MRTESSLLPLVAVLALAVGCTPAPAQNVELPPNLEVVAGPLFSLDLTTPVHSTAVVGAPGVELLGVLADGDGRRRLELRGGAFDGQIIAEAGWHVLTSAARTDAALLVCWSELTGAPSSLTGGAMPDPTQGMALRCQMHTARGWTALEDVAPEAAAAWIRSVAPDGDGFAVDYRRDAGWLLVDVAPTDGDYRRIVRTDGRVGPPHPVPAPVARRKS